MTDHIHSHDHDHVHAHVQDVSGEERLALLKYMLSHNAHHAEELHELAHGIPGEAEELLHAAVADIESSNEKLARAIEMLEK